MLCPVVPQCLKVGQRKTVCKGHWGGDASAVRKRNREVCREMQEGKVLVP
jgi:hypothetical protein